MPTEPGREPPLSALDAAKLLFNTDQPTPEQVGQVRLRIAKGKLKSAGDSAHTTARSVAEYMAKNAVARQREGAKSRELTGFYHQLLRDYFMAVVVRRKIGHRSQAFQNSVVLGQIALLLLIVFATWQVGRRVFQGEAAHHRLVRQHLEAELGPITVHQWLPVVTPDAAPGVIVRPQFSYRSAGGRWVRTERSYVVQGEEVGLYSTSDE